ncbi:MAG: hypothetical protein LBQ40_06920 [Clostridiales bacterium]|jgi:hypothetical protein|nr:hypothetical protein [Clostridiales bacterium]
MTLEKKIRIVIAAIVIAAFAAFLAYNIVKLFNVYNPFGLTPDPSAARFEKQGNFAVITNGYSKLSYDLNGGVYDVAYNNTLITGGAYSYAEIKLGETAPKNKYYSYAAESRSYSYSRISDAFGDGIRLAVENKFNDLDMTEYFYIYDKTEYIISQTVFSSSSSVLYSNDMRYIFSGGSTPQKTASTSLGNMKSLSFLETPFDNNEYEEFTPCDLGRGANCGYGVSMIFSQTKSEALIIGALDNGVFKNALVADSVSAGLGAAKLTSLYMRFGRLGYESRDYGDGSRTAKTIEHGYISGGSISSPRLFYGYYPDYRDGLEQYGDCAKIAEPPLEWEYPTPVGYNSWAALGFDVSYDTMTEMSDYIKDNLPNYGAGANVYLNFDSGFLGLTEEQRAAFPKYAAKNGQKAGAYWTPFTFWGDAAALQETAAYSDGSPITDDDGNTYKYEELIVKDLKGRPIRYSGYCLDPTHPIVLKRADDFFARLIAMGYEYVKMDFINDGSVEGTHYNADISTGMEAFNYGMKHIADYVGENSPTPFFLNAAISPVFSGRYIHSRRISCDVFEKIDNTRYLLNTLSFAWWMNGRIISISDPDHLVLAKSIGTDKRAEATAAEAASALNSRLIGGSLIMWSDNLKNPSAVSRSKQALNNGELLYLAKRKTAFRPAASGSVSTVYYTDDGSHLYFALFNINSFLPRLMTINLNDYGVNGTVSVKNLNSGETFSSKNGKLTVLLKPNDSAILRVG